MGSVSQLNQYLAEYELVLDGLRQEDLANFQLIQAQKERIDSLASTLKELTDVIKQMNDNTKEQVFIIKQLNANSKAAQQTIDELVQETAKLQIRCAYLENFIQKKVNSKLWEGYE